MMMKRLIAILALIPLLAMGGGQNISVGKHRFIAPASTTMAYVNGGGYGPFTTTSGNSFGAQSIWSVSAGNTLVVVFSLGTAVNSSVCTGGGVVANPGSYAMTVLLNGYVASRGSACVFYLDNTPSGINSITVNTGTGESSKIGSFVAAEFSGLSATAAVNGTPLNTLSAYVNPGTWTTTSATTATGGPSLCLAGDVMYQRSDQTAWSHGSGWTAGPGILNSSTSLPGVYLEYVLNASAGSYTGTGGYTLSSGASGYDNAWVGCLM